MSCSSPEDYVVKSREFGDGEKAVAVDVAVKDALIGDGGRILYVRRREREIRHIDFAVAVDVA